MNYRELNYEVMSDTLKQCESLPELKKAIQSSVSRQFMVSHEDDISRAKTEQCNTRIVISGKRSFEAAKGYKGSKTAVLNFANNHNIGGSPFTAGAQEESLCRCSTLYPCLKAMEKEFYAKHRHLRKTREMDHMGNDDLIYTPDVIVFKTDERTDPIYPKMMNPTDWYSVDVITCAAPELWHGNQMPNDYEAQITSRIKKIFDVAAKEKAEVLILGAWGCGAFHNPSDIVARVFMEQLRNYNFPTIEFAIASNQPLSENPFATELKRNIKRDAS
ncbi:MAG: TIGR02452 family protein [Bacteroidales bacterium]|nr:TIGR02452 family protein [Bacteroidales bacterium]